MLKESAFNIYRQTQEGYLIYNTLYSGFAQIDMSEYRGIKNLVSGLLPQETIQLLKMNGFLIDSDINEIEVYDKIRCAIIDLQEEGGAGYTIAVTTDCNAKCSYCYEKGTDIIYMDRQCADGIISFIKKNYNGNSIRITWFGGEPLLNTEIINYICRRLSEENIEFISSIISNGFLFNNEIIIEAKNKWNLEHAQISLDGTETKYNKIKNYKVVTHINPFEKVIKNIIELLENKISVSIRLNISRHNVENIKELVEYLSEKIPFSKHLVIYPAFVEGLGKEYSLDDEEKVLIIKKFLDILPFYSLIWYRYKLCEKPYLFACMRENLQSIFIDADGSICRCEHYVGRKKFKNINYSISCNTNGTIEKFCDVKMDYEIDEECKECKYYPRCLGGCMADRLDGNGYCSIDRYIIEAVIRDFE